MTPRRQHAYDLKRSGLTAHQISIRMEISTERVYQLLRKGRKQMHDAQRQLEREHAEAGGDVPMTVPKAKCFIDVMEVLKNGI